MKNKTGYGTFDLTRQIARRIQLEWDMVEQPKAQPRFTNFPYSELPETPAPVVRREDTQRRRLAA